MEAARRYGVSVSAQHGSFTCGQLSWFTERLAAAGLVAVATAVSPALLAPSRTLATPSDEELLAEVQAQHTA